MRIQIYQSSDDNYVCFSLTNCSRLKVGKPKYFLFHFIQNLVLLCSVCFSLSCFCNNKSPKM